MTRISNNGAATAAVNSRAWEEMPAPVEETPREQQTFYRIRNGVEGYFDANDNPVPPPPEVLQARAAQEARSNPEGPVCLALAAMLRHPQLQPLLGIGAGRNNPSLDLASVLRGGIWQADQAWGLAERLYSTGNLSLHTMRALLPTAFQGLPADPQLIEDICGETYATVSLADGQRETLAYLRRRYAEHIARKDITPDVEGAISALTELQGFNAATTDERGYRMLEIVNNHCPLEWFVEDFVPKGETCWIAGVSKTLKSGLALALAFALAAPVGHPAKQFLGQFACPEQVSVIYYSAEGGRQLAESRLKALLAHYNIDPATADWPLEMHFYPAHGQEGRQAPGDSGHPGRQRQGLRDRPLVPLPGQGQGRSPGGERVRDG